MRLVCNARGVSNKHCLLPFFILFAVYLEARNIALDFKVFFFMSLSSHQSEKLSRSAFKKAVTVLS